METGIVMAILAFAMGGVLKGAIGAGTPVIAVPILSLYYGVPFAVTVFALPAVLSNLLQLWQFRRDLLPERFIWPMGLGAGVGAGLGTVILVSLPAQILMISVAGATLAYVGFRLARPDWQLGYDLAARVVLPVSVLAGIMQGAAGISAPISLTFISALRLERAAFIGTISAFFLAMSLVQLPALWGVGLLTGEKLLYSLGLCIPLFAAMPLGGWLARFIPPAMFERIVMALLVLIAARLLWAAFHG